MALAAEGTSPAGDAPAGRAAAALAAGQSPTAAGTAEGPAPPELQEPRLPDGFQFPLMAKASQGGYDGRGTRTIADLEALRELLGAVDPAGWILEEMVPFERELALTACRDRHEIGRAHV